MKNFYEWNLIWASSQCKIPCWVLSHLSWTISCLFCTTQSLVHSDAKFQTMVLAWNLKCELHNIFLSTRREKINGVRHGYPCFGKVMLYHRSTTFMCKRLEWRAKGKGSPFLMRGRLQLGDVELRHDLKIRLDFVKKSNFKIFKVMNLRPKLGSTKCFEHRI